MILNELAGVLDRVEALRRQQDAQRHDGRPVATQIVTPFQRAGEQQQRQRARRSNPDGHTQQPHGGAPPQRAKQRQGGHGAGSLARVQQREDRQARLMVEFGCGHVKSPRYPIDDTSCLHSEVRCCQ
jgi:hypothetical protein